MYKCVYEGLYHLKSFANDKPLALAEYSELLYMFLKNLTHCKQSIYKMFCPPECHWSSCKLFLIQNQSQAAPLIVHEVSNITHVPEVHYFLSDFSVWRHDSDVLDIFQTFMNIF